MGSQNPFLKSPIFLRISHKFLRKNIKLKEKKTHNQTNTKTNPTTSNKHTSRKTQTSKPFYEHPGQLTLKKFLFKKSFFSIGKSSVIRKVNFAVVNEVTQRYCYTLTGKLIFTLLRSSHSPRMYTGKLEKTGYISFEKQIHPRLQEKKKEKKKLCALPRKKPLKC